MGDASVSATLRDSLIVPVHDDEQPASTSRPQRRGCGAGVLAGACIGALGALIAVAACARLFAQHAGHSWGAPSWASPPRFHGTALSSTLPGRSHAVHATPLKGALERCEAYIGREIDLRDDDLSLILTADPGDFSGVSEAHYILENLVQRHDAPRDSTVCGVLSSGLLMGQLALVVMTGIGPAAASLCTFEVLSHCGAFIKEAIYFGTSGWSSQPGGVLNPPACGAANWRPQNVTRTGDVCVSPFSVNWTCKKSSWTLQAAGAPNQCTRPEELASPADTPLFGECQFYKDHIDNNLDLADDLLDVARSVGAARNFPPRSVNVTRHEHLYWSTMAEGAAQKAPELDADAPPNVWDYSECMEVDGQFFYSGSPWELKARDYAAATLNAALDLLHSRSSEDDASYSAARLVQSGKRRVSSADMIAVSAMEGVGVSEALLRYHALSTTRQPVPFTNVRTLSNWLVPPLVQTSPGVWQVLREVPEDFVNGYAYAIGTGSATIMSLYQDRCLQRLAAGPQASVEGQQQRLSAHPSCKFVIDTDKLVTLLVAQQAAPSHRDL